MYTLNISGDSIGNNGFMRFLIEQFSRYPIPPQTICFEITETAVLANFEQARYFMSELKKIGCCFALDDLGSGLSSWAYLMNLPVYILSDRLTIISRSGRVFEMVNYWQVLLVNPPLQKSRSLDRTWYYYLKIDGAFVKNISHNLISQALVEGFNGIADAMNVETIAEFVEDETILEKLREMGVDYAQGYGLSHPVPINFNR